MPWKEVKPMDQKLLFIADHLRKVAALSDLCRRYGISRKTGYKWLARYQEMGVEGLHDQSRRPKNQPLRTPFAVRKAIIELRLAHRDPPGPKKIRIKLEQRHPDWDIPSETTIYNILVQEDLIHAQKRRKRVPAGPQPFSPVYEPNDVWSADFKGQFKTRDGCWCYPLTIMDHQSRYLLACHSLPGTEFKQTQDIFAALFREHGLPWRIRTDNGAPFASCSLAGLSRLSAWWVRLGILPERIEAGKPQQNGRHERMHRTLKRAATIPPALSPQRQQHVFDEFRLEYNHERPHESLKQRTPAAIYRPSLRKMPEKLPELEYPGHFLVNLVNHNGIIGHRGHRVYIACMLKGEKVGLEQMTEDIWEVYFGPLRLGRFDMSQTQRAHNDYLRLKV